MLAWLTRTTVYGGNIASVGLAAGAKLETTVIACSSCAPSACWGSTVSRRRGRFGSRCGGESRPDLAPRHLDRIVSREIPFDLLAGSFADYVKGGITGRTVVRIG